MRTGSRSSPADHEAAGRGAEPTGSAEWLLGGGELGELIRSTDWSRTPLGPRDRWPVSLKTVVSLLVESRFPMALVWGRELTLLYNDAYRAIAADKHPRALGRSTRDVWPEVWHVGEPILAAVTERGESIYLEDKLFSIDRRGRREEAWFTLGCSPVRAEDGAIFGALVTLQETTGRVVDRSRLEAERERALDVFEHGEACSVLDDRKQAEERLRASERRLGLAMDVAQAAAWEVDCATGEHFLEDRALRLLRVPPGAEAEVPPRWPELVVPEDRARATAEFQAACEEGAAPFDCEFRAQRLDGVVRWYASHGVQLVEAGGGRRLVGILQDITERREAEQALGRRERQFRVLLENLYSGVALIDAAGRFTLYNARFLQLFGLSSDADIHNVNSQDWGAWQVFDERERLLDLDDHPVRRVALTCEPVRNQLVGVRLPAGGDLVWMLISAAPLLGSEGKIEHIICSYHEITDRRRAEQALRDREAALRERAEELETVMGLAPVAIWVAHDPQCQQIQGNDTANRFYEAAPGENVSAGPAPDEQVRPRRFFQDGRELTAAELPMQRAAAEGLDIRNAELEVITPSGTRRSLLGSARPLRDSANAVRGCVGAFLDITERKQTEDALRQANQRLQEADRRKNEFLAVLSHELRNPLAPIRNSVYVLERTAPGGEQAQRARQVIDRQAQHMTRLIEDLLDITRISRGKITLQRKLVDLADLAREVAEDHREVYAKKGIELVVERRGGSVWVHGDRTRLAQAIGNLLNNSEKFTPRGGTVVLTVEAGGPSEAVVKVRDNGAGIAPETLAHMFEPFVQAAQSLERTHGGLGLGLALVKGLVEMHGGRVVAHSAGVGQGAEFVLTLPARPSPGPQPATDPAAPPGEATAQRVLVVEDNLDAAQSLREALALADHEVVIAASGPEGLELARALKPDVVLCDLGLPELDGYGVARALRADPDPALRSALLVALSGYALQEDVERSRDAGFDLHMAKPPDLARLLELLARRPS